MRILLSRLLYTHQGKTADIFIPKKVWNRPIKVWKPTVFQENSNFIPQGMKMDCQSLVSYLGHIFHTLGTFFIPWASFSYLEHVFHTLVSLVFFHTVDIIFIPLSIFSYLQWVYLYTFGMRFHTKTIRFHTSWSFFSYLRNCHFIPTTVGFTPGTDLFIPKLNNS